MAVHCWVFATLQGKEGDGYMLGKGCLGWLVSGSAEGKWSSSRAGWAVALESGEAEGAALPQ